jgi:hypothetical protein
LYTLEASEAVDDDGLRADERRIWVPNEQRRGIVGRRAGNPLRRAGRWLLSHRGRAAAGIATALVFIQTVGVSFLWPQFIAPMTVPPALHLSATITQLPGNAEHGLIPLEVSVQLENISSTRVKVVASHFNLYGVQVIPIGPSASAEADATEEFFPLCSNQPIANDRSECFPAPAARTPAEEWDLGLPAPPPDGVVPGTPLEQEEELTYYHSEEAELIQYNWLLPATSYFEPSEKSSMTFVVYVPIDTFDKVSFWSQVSIAKHEVSVQGFDEGSGGWFGGLRDWISPRTMIGARCAVKTDQDPPSFGCDFYKWTLDRGRDPAVEARNKENALRAEDTDPLVQDHLLVGTAASSELSLWEPEPTPPAGIEAPTR